MTASLDALLAGLDARISGDPHVPIHGVCYDSRKVTRGVLFVALRGEHTDGHAHIDQAIHAGAQAVLVERDVPISGGPATLARVASTRHALPRVAARFYGEPARDMTLIGVTGTNGKTSTVRLIESILASSGRAAGSLGTISSRYAGREESASLTTPESVELQQTLRQMRDAGVDHVALEVSSHSLEAGRVATLHFSVSVFTNLTQDHLDFHGDMERYGRAKGRLFEPEYLRGWAILPAHDPQSAAFERAARAGNNGVLTFSRCDATADVRTRGEQVDLAGSHFELLTPSGTIDVRLPLAGDFQIDNALAAAGCAHALGISNADIAAGLAGCAAVPGRLERVASGAPAVFVDYAHTPDALERVLERVRPLVRG